MPVWSASEKSTWVGTVLRLWKAGIFQNVSPRLHLRSKSLLSINFMHEHTSFHFDYLRCGCMKLNDKSWHGTENSSVVQLFLQTIDDPDRRWHHWQNWWVGNSHRYRGMKPRYSVHNVKTNSCGQYAALPVIFSTISIFHCITQLYSGGSY